MTAQQPLQPLSSNHQTSTMKQSLQLPALPEASLKPIQDFIKSYSEGHQYTVAGVDHRGRYQKTLFKAKALSKAFVGSDFNSLKNDVWVLTWDTVKKITCKVWNPETKQEENVLIYQSK